MTASARITVSRSAGRSWDEATFDAVAAILPEIHAIEPKQG